MGNLSAAGQASKGIVLSTFTVFWIALSVLFLSGSQTANALNQPTYSRSIKNHNLHNSNNNNIASSTTTSNHNIMSSATGSQYPIYGPESIMSTKSHGTCEKPVQKDLRWGCDNDTADRICCYNRHYAEHSGFFQGVKKYMADVSTDGAKEITFYDSVTGKPLFIAPKNRSMKEFLDESKSHGWPSFRDDEVVWENVRCLDNGESVSVDGTHLGHNLPDRKGNRYCINLVSVAGNPIAGKTESSSSSSGSDKSSL